MLKEHSASELMSSKNNSFISKMKSQFFIYIQFIYSILRNIDWTRTALKTIKNELELSSFDCIISSYPSLGSHWVSMQIAKKHNLKWIAEFRDPINYESNSNKVILFLNTRLQKRIVKNASLVTFISKEMLLKLNKGGKLDSKKFIHIPNGYDPDEYKEVQESVNDNSKLVFSYVGSLYGGERDLRIIFEIIRYLIDTGGFNPQNFEVNYAGSEIEVIRRQAQEFNLKEIVVNKGYIRREEAIALQNASDLLIVVTWNTTKDKGIVTGKLFECLLTDKMILGVVNGNVPNSEFKSIIEEVNGGFVIEDASINYSGEKESLKNFINEKLVEKLEYGKVESNYNNKKINYSYPIIARKYTALIEN